MDAKALAATLNGSHGCRCHDAAAILKADLDGRPGPRETCGVHSAAGRDAVEQRVRIDALAELYRETRAKNEQTLALNSPTLADIARQAFEAAPTTPTAE
jgi:hypothetical protein